MKKGVHGEGNYEAARQYDERTKKYLESADVTEDARNAQPRDAAEARELEEAEAQGRRRAKTGEGQDTAGGPQAPDSDDV